MHDIDRNQLEGEMEFGEFESEFEFPGELQEVFNEAEQMELAGELLEVRDEQELNHFLGDLIRKASGVLGKAVNSPLGTQLGTILKSSARNAALQAVPVVSDAIGKRIGGRLGPSIAKGLTAFGTSALNSRSSPAPNQEYEFEYESLSQEDREFEGAKQFVQLAADTVKNATTAPPGADPRVVARSALIKAARTVAPGLLQPAGASAAAVPGAPHRRGSRRSGVWYRHGTKIVLQGV
jgi:hypothetical protein